jgi:hypothetical protein
VKWLRLVVGPQPVLRLIALLLGVIAVLLFLLLQEAGAIKRSIYTPDVCGDAYHPCEVRVTNGF